MLRKVSAALITIVAMAGATLTAAPAQAGPAVTHAPTASTAAPTARPYPDSIATRTRVRFAKNPIKSGQRARVIIRVRGTGSARDPRTGRVVVTVFGTQYRKRVEDGVARVRLERLYGFRNRARVYNVRARFQARPDSIFRNSRGSNNLTVRSRR